MADYIGEYASYLRLERCSSDNTITSYVRDVTQFCRYLEEVEETELLQCAQEHIERYIAYMTGRGKSAASVARSVASLKSFYSYLLSQGVVRSNPAKHTAAVRTERKLPQILSGKEVDLFLEQPQCVDPKGYRDHAMLELLYATGIRVSELIGLNVEDVNLPAGLIRCVSRGKERIIPLYAAAVKALTDYVRDIRPQLVLTPREPALFVNMSGERRGSGRSLSTTRRRRRLTRTSPRTPCATPLLPICWRMGRICAPFRRCWAMRIYPPPRYTPTWSSRSSRTSIIRPTPGHRRGVQR